MSTSSDSEDEAQKQQFLDAADTTLFSNSMFQQTQMPVAEEGTATAAVTKPIEPPPKSQRYLPDDCNLHDSDLILPPAVQKHISKKLSNLISERIEFSDITIAHPPKYKKFHSKVKLLRGDECYVKPYEEFEYEESGPTKKPNIKRRVVEPDPADESTRLESVAVDAEFVIAQGETKNWQLKPERKDKVFHYRQSSDGKLHAKERIDEFTQLRKKNKWTENKIRLFKQKTK